MDGKVMTADEQAEHQRTCLVVRECLSALRLIRKPDAEDLNVARARLENWLTENDGRWTT